MSQPQFGPMKIVRSDLSGVRVSLPTSKRVQLVVAGLPIVVSAVWFVFAIATAWSVDLLIGHLILWFLASGAALICISTPALFAIRSLQIQISAKGLSFHGLRTRRWAWTDVAEVDVTATSARHATLCLRDTGGHSHRWRVLLGDGKDQPGLSHYQEFVAFIERRAAQLPNEPGQVPDSLQRLSETERS